MMTFDEIWKDVQGLSEEAKRQVPGILKEDTNKKLAKITPDEIEEIVAAAIEEVNQGSIEPLDTLIKRHI